ncbi:MAG: hypothetical protein AcusKO_15770 [Acuticoccus sp.]
MVPLAHDPLVENDVTVLGVDQVDIDDDDVVRAPTLDKDNRRVVIEKILINKRVNYIELATIRARFLIGLIIFM